MTELGQETVDAADAAIGAGYRVLGERPELLAACERAAMRAAERLGDMGDVSAATMERATDALAAWAGKNGLPDTADDCAALVDSLAKMAARRARDEQRAAWAPRIREARPSDAPNVIERWNLGSLLEHAGRYTMGALTTREQATAVLDAHAAYAWPIVHRVARVERATCNGDRVVSSERVGGAICAPRHSGSTSPDTASVWARERGNVRMRGAMARAMGAETVDALADAYRPERVRRIRGRGKRVGDVLRTRRVSWARVAEGTGRDRGTVRRETVRGAGRVAALVSAGERADHAAGRAWAGLERATR